MCKKKDLRGKFLKCGKRSHRLFFICQVFFRKKSQSLRLQIDQRIAKNQDSIVEKSSLTRTEAGQGNGFHPDHGITGNEALVGNNVIACIGWGKNGNP